MKMVILARGGSKGIPRKNLRKVNGISLIARSIIAATKSLCVSDVIVSTDDEEIANEAKLFGALVHIRNDFAGTDTASTEDALSEFLENNAFSVKRDEFFGYMQPTSPFVAHDEIDEAFNILKSRGDISTIFSARESHAFLWESTKDSNISYGINHEFDVQRSRRQDYDSVQLVENGAFYLLRTEKYIATQNRFGNYPYAFASRVLCPVEIDSFLDLEICRRIAPLFDNDLILTKRPSLIISDFDGVFTSDNVYVSDTGSEAIKSSRADGQGIKKLQEVGINIIIVSSESNEVAKYRAEKMGVPIYLGIKEKLPFIKVLAADLGFEMTDIAYIGNDLNDLDVLQQVGIPLIPLNASKQLYAEGFSIIPISGGDGVIRYLGDLL